MRDTSSQRRTQVGLSSTGDTVGYEHSEPFPGPRVSTPESAEVGDALGESHVSSLSPLVDECRDDDADAEQYDQLNQVTVSDASRTEPRRETEYDEEGCNLGVGADQATRPLWRLF